MKSWLPAVILSCLLLKSNSQDTFSIVAADSTTHEVGSAGASCVDLFAAGISDPSFLGDLITDTGAINTQVNYLANNQTNARVRMRLGESPSDIIEWLASHDAQGNSSMRQYGIVGFTNGTLSAAGFTGTNCVNYKNHITGNIDGFYYSIQGNILLGPEILQNMETNFRNTSGDLACRLMAALQGAKVVGADTRCAPNESSTLFAFVKVSDPNDAYGNPSFSVGIRTHNNAFIEPIDTLQTLFDNAHNCKVSGIPITEQKDLFSLSPNPANGELCIRTDNAMIGSTLYILDLAGRILWNAKIEARENSINLKDFQNGYYLVQIPGHKVKSFIIVKH